MKIKVQYILKTFSLQNNFTEITLECILIFHFVNVSYIYISIYIYSYINVFPLF